MKVNKIRYIIVGPARSGTTVTHICLYGHPNTSCLNDEILVDPFFSKGLSTFTHGNDTHEEKEKGYLAIFDAITSIKANKATTVLGLKTVITSVHKAKILTDSIRRHFKTVKIIITIRDDIVAQYGSLLRAKRTGKLHSWVETKNPDSPFIEFERNEFVKYAIENLKIIKELKTLNNTHEVLEVSYEKDILTDFIDYKKIFSFLNLPMIEANWIYSKKVSPAPEKYIKNYYDYLSLLKEIRTAFKDGHIDDTLFLKRSFRVDLLRTIKKVLKIKGL